MMENDMETTFKKIILIPKVLLGPLRGPLHALPLAQILNSKPLNPRILNPKPLKP